MFNSLFANYCCPEPVAAPDVIYSHTDENVPLPNLLPGAIKQSSKVDASPLLPPQSPNVDQLTEADAQAHYVLSQSTGETIADLDGVVSTGTGLLPEKVEHATVQSEHQKPQDQTNARGPSTSRSQTDLEELIGNFVKQASQGSACTYFDEQTGKRISATYRIDKDSTHIMVEATQGSFLNRVAIKCPIAAIVDIDNFDGCNLSFPTAVKKSLTENEQKCLLMVFYAGGKGKMRSFCLLEKSREDRELFSKAVKALSSPTKA